MKNKPFLDDDLTKIRDVIIGKYVQLVKPYRSYDIVRAPGMFGVHLKRTDVAYCLSDALFAGVAAIASKEELVSIMRLTEDYVNYITIASMPGENRCSSSVEKIVDFVQQGKMDKEFVSRGLQWVYEQGSKINDEVKLTEELYMQASCAEIGVFIRLLNIGHTQMVENFTSFLLETIPKFAAVTLM